MKRWLNLLLILGILLLAFALVTLVLLLAGRPPFALYQSLLRVVSGLDVSRAVGARGWFTLRYPGEWLVSSMPLILTGLSMGFALRTGLWNIGAEGQYTMGMLAAVLVALYFPPIPGLHLVAALLGAALGGALWGGLAGWMKARFDVSEVVATIMLNYIALYLSRIILLRLPGSNTYQTMALPPTALLDSSWLSALSGGARLNYGIFVVLLALIFYGLVLSRSVFGLHLRAAGFNPEAAAGNGIAVNRNRLFSMLIAGTFAGLAGAIVNLGSFENGRILAAMDGVGFAGITVALVGGATAVGIGLAGLLFAGLVNAQSLVQLKGVPRDVVDLISGLIVMMIAFRPGLAQRLMLVLQRRRVRMMGKEGE